MIIGLGIDLVEIDRIKRAVDHQCHLPNRLLTPKELAIYQGYGEKRKIEFLAGRFAGKEAYAKARGCGIGQLSFKDIEILPDEAGKPTIRSVNADEFVLISITHTDNHAMAQVIIQKLV